MKFFTGLYLGDLMLRSSFSLLSGPLSYSSCRDTYQTCIPSFLSKYAPLCVPGNWSTVGPQLKPRDKNIIAVSAGKKPIRVLQIGPFRILTGQTCEADAVSHSRWGGFLWSSWKRLQLLWQINSTLLEALTDKNRRSFGVIHTVFLHRQFINDIPQCQRHTPSLPLHFTLPWILFLPSEEGRRCKITGLPESNSLELELRLLPCEMKCCTPLGRRLGALWLSSWGYLTLSKAGFVLCGSYLQPPPLSVCLYTLSVLSQAPGLQETLLPWQRREHLNLPRQ